MDLQPPTQNVYFVPTYIGSLKYYAKLFPALIQAGHKPCFLIVRGRDARREQMVSHCERAGYAYHVLATDAVKSKGFSLPFIRSYLERYRYMLLCRDTLKDLKPDKLVGVKNVSNTELLFREANYLGIETLILQPAFTPPLNHYVPENERRNPLWLRLYQMLLKVGYIFFDLVLRGPQYLRTTSFPARVGVIGQEGRKALPERFGYDPRYVTVVGNADYQVIHTLRTRLQEKPEIKESLLKKYDLDPHKKRVLVLSSWPAHYILPKTKHTSEEIEEQVLYFQRVLTMVREKLPEAEILFKLHPAEENIYESYVQLGIKLFADESTVDELLCLSDLYIADPATSANYMLVGSGISALFINFSKVGALDKTAPFYNIRHVVKDWSELGTLLESFRDGKLAAQYDTAAIDTGAIDTICSFLLKKA